MEHIGEAIFDIPSMIQSQAESMKKILKPFKIYQLIGIANSAIICGIGFTFFLLISDGLGGVHKLTPGAGPC